MTTVNGKLGERAMIVRLTIGQWTARRFDRKVSQEVADNHKAEMDAGRYNKVLIARKELSKISVIVGQTRAYHYDHTLPWTDEGGRILASALFFDYTKEMAEYKAKFERCVTVFMDNYDQYVQDAAQHLGSMFDAKEYPRKGELRSKYKFETDIYQLPEARDFRVNLPDTEVEMIKKQITANLRQAAAEAMADLWKRLYEVVNTMADRLSTKDAIFRDSLFGNVVELTQLLPKMNITGDPKLDEMVKDVERKLCMEPDAVRDDPKLRKKVAKSADEILEQMKGYVGGR